MNFENYANRIVSLTNFNFFEKLPAEYKEVLRLTIYLGEMQKRTSIKTNFLNLTARYFTFPTE